MMVAEKTGWTKHEILHNLSFAEINLMLADTPRMIKKENTKTEFKSDNEIAEWLGSI